MVDKAIIGIVAVVVVVLVIVGVFTLGSKPTTHVSSTTTILSVLNGTNSQTTTIQPVSVPPTPANASVSRRFISESASAGLMGAGGTYGIYMRSTALQLQASMPPTFSPFNITGEYNMTYTVNVSKGTANAISEVIFKNAHPQKLYVYFMNQYPYFNSTLLESQGATNITSMLNKTYSGITYSASSFIVRGNATAQNRTALSLQIIFGYEGSNTTFVISTLQLNNTKALNATALVALAAKNLNNPLTLTKRFKNED